MAPSPSSLHAVDVVTINSDGTYTLRNGGWNTVTTMERIRGYAPVRSTIGSDARRVVRRYRAERKIRRPSASSRTIPKPFTASDSRRGACQE